MATERLKVILEMAAGQYKREAREAASATGTISDKAEATKKSISGFKSAAVIGGVVAVGRGLWSAVEAAEQASSAMANTEQIIKQTGGVANVTGEDIAELSRKLSALTGVEDEVVQEGTNVLLTFRNIRNEVGEGNDVFDRTASLMLDIGAVMGTDASSAALQLGKALNDPVSQMGALSRAGLTFDASQKEMIKSLVQSGDLLSAQKIILSELETQLGGTAAASADASDKIGSAFGEIGESIGTGLLPFLESTAIELQSIVGLIDDLDRYAAITGQNRESAELLAGALFKLGKEHERAAIQGGNHGDVIADFTKDAEALVDMAGISVTELRRVRDGLDFLVDTMGLSEKQAEALAAVIDEKLNSELARLTDIGADQVLRGKLNPALTETGDILTTVVGPGLDETRERLRNGEMTWQQYGSVVEDTTGLIEGNMEALQAYFDLVDGRMDSIRNLAEHEEKVAEATDASAEALMKYGPESDEYLEALDAQSQALQDQRDAQRRLVEQGGQTRAEFILQQVELGLTYEEAIKLADEYDHLFTPRSVTNTITNQIVNVTTNKQGGSAGSATVDKALAGGGSLFPGELALVGEDGPELAVTHTPTQIFDTTSTSSILKALSGLSASVSKSYDFNFNGPVTGVDEIMHAVQRAHGRASMVDLAEVNPR